MLHKSTKIIATTGALFLLVSVTAFVSFFWVVTNQKEHFILQTTERAQTEAHQKSLAVLMRTLEETKAPREKLFSRILKEENVIDFLALVESFGKEQGLVLTTNSLTVEPIDNVFETLVVGVSVEGSYTSVMQILKILEHLPYQASIRNLSFTRGDGERRNVWGSEYSVRVTKFKKHEI